MNNASKNYKKPKYKYCECCKKYTYHYRNRKLDMSICAAIFKCVICGTNIDIWELHDTKNI